MEIMTCRSILLSKYFDDMALKVSSPGEEILHFKHFQIKGILEVI